MRMLLGIAGLMLMWICCGTSIAQPREPVRKGAMPREVTGHGETVDSAKRAAFRKAVEEVNDLLTVNDLRSFKVTEEYLVDKHILQDTGHPGKDVQVDNIGNPFKTWILPFRTDTTDWWKDLERRDHEAYRNSIGEERQNLAARLMAGLTVLLLAGYGYVRVDAFTRYRYTTWLRLVLVTAVSTILASCYWLLRVG